MESQEIKKLEEFQLKAEKAIEALKVQVDSMYTKAEVETLIANVDIQAKLDVLEKTTDGKIDSAVEYAVSTASIAAGASIDAFKSDLKTALKAAGSAVKGTVLGAVNGNDNQESSVAAIKNMGGVVQLTGKQVTVNNKPLLPFDDTAHAVETSVQNTLVMVADEL
jgi:hypothetical protein